MGKNQKIEMSKYILISGFNIHDNNRGTAALSYGSLFFLQEKSFLKKGQQLINYRYYKNPFKSHNRKNSEEYFQLGGDKYLHTVFNVLFVEKWLFDKLGIILPFTNFGQTIKQVELVAAINGGDGFSDIYDTQTFISRLFDIDLAMRLKLPLILLPQTIGPFESKNNSLIAERILRYASKIYIRDDKYIANLKDMGLSYEMTKDLSYYMQPQRWDIDVIDDSIGINISGLSYSNKFRTLSNQFEYYPLLIERLIFFFQEKGKHIYLIPHSYNYVEPELNNDDMVACREVYNNLKNKANVILIDKDLIAPQVKYIISRMSFFIGTRMHANFAAIYTGVPLFGLAYSYKFQGAFEANGIYGHIALINNITAFDIDNIIREVDRVYNDSMKK